MAKRRWCVWLALCALLCSCDDEAANETKDGGMDAAVDAAMEPIAVLESVTYLGGGSDHVCAVLDSGRVACWGRNDIGQLGDGTDQESVVPRLVDGVEGAMAVTGSAFGTCALMQDRTVTCWGQLVTAPLSEPELLRPRRIEGLSDVVQIAMGTGHACAVVEDGSLYCWGDNDHLQIGEGAEEGETPIRIETVDEVQAVAAGNGTTCAVERAGSVKCWGTNFPGGEVVEHEDGNEITVEVPPPIEVEGVTNAVAISGRGGQACAVTSDATVVCFGSLGRDEPPVVWPSVESVVDVAAGYHHACAVVEGGEVFCWGLNSDGQLGLGRLEREVPTPTRVPDLDGVSRVVAGNMYSCALTNMGTVSCWGQGPTGNGVMRQEVNPVQVLEVGAKGKSIAPPLPSDCPEPPVSADALDATPRDDENLESMALAHGDGLTADQALYDRLVRDVAAIRAEASELSHIEFHASDDGKSFSLEVDESTFEAMVDERYHAWDCLNGLLGLQQLHFSSFGSLSVFVALEGNYDMTRLVRLYAELPGVQEAYVNGRIGGGPHICLTREDELWHYVLDDAGGDCPSGCTTHEWHYFTTDTFGTASKVDAWDGEGDPPTWFETYAGRAACAPISTRPPAACEELDRIRCEDAAQWCTGIYGYILQQPPRDELYYAFAGCREASSDCSDGLFCGHTPPNDNTHLFNGCMPEGWETADNAKCDLLRELASSDPEGCDWGPCDN